MRIAFTTWQFVRVMVRLEDTRKDAADRRVLYREWADDWKLLDAELERLRDANFDAFSELMMEREVVFADVSPETARTVAAVIDEVIDQLVGERRGASRQARDDLDFERAELTGLAAELRIDADRAQ
jgi:predicted RNA-binding Zn ribbon-like protein